MIEQEEKTYIPEQQDYPWFSYVQEPPKPAQTSPVPPTPPLPPTTTQKHLGPGRPLAIVFLALVLLAVMGVGLFAGWEYGSKSSATSTGSSTTATTSTTGTTNAVDATQEAAIAKIEPSVVEIVVTTSQGEQLGSGVIIDKNGDIVTNNHVVAGEQSIEVVLSNGSKEQGQLVGTKAADDLAVVRIQPYTGMTVAQIGNSSTLVVGQEVLAVGNPLGITETATSGIVSALNRSVAESSTTTIANAIQTDAPINPGNSGGALINLQGQLVGIPTLTAVNTESNTAAEGISFAIPSNVVTADVQQIISVGA